MKKSVPDKNYAKIVKEITPGTPVIKNCLIAFISGGLMCVAGEFLFNLYQTAGLQEKVARTGVSISVIVLTVVLSPTGVSSFLLHAVIDKSEKTVIINAIYFFIVFTCISLISSLWDRL